MIVGFDGLSQRRDRRRDVVFQCSSHNGLVDPRCLGKFLIGDFLIGGLLGRGCARRPRTQRPNSTGDTESDKGAFLDQFFKSGKIEGNKLAFTTEVVHGVSFDFRGTIERGEGKNPGDEAFFVVKGALTENVSDVNKKVSSHTRDVVFKMFPQEATPAPGARQ